MKYSVQQRPTPLSRSSGPANLWSESGLEEDLLADAPPPVQAPTAALGQPQLGPSESSPPAVTMILVNPPQLAEDMPEPPSVAELQPSEANKRLAPSPVVDKAPAKKLPPPPRVPSQVHPLVFYCLMACIDCSYWLTPSSSLLSLPISF